MSSARSSRSYSTGRPDLREALSSSSSRIDLLADPRELRQAHAQSPEQPDCIRANGIFVPISSLGFGLTMIVIHVFIQTQ